MDKIPQPSGNLILCRAGVPVAQVAQDSTKGVQGSLSDIASFPDDRLRVTGSRCCRFPSGDPHFDYLDVKAARTFVSPLIVTGFGRLKGLNPHHAAALRARRVSQRIDNLGMFHLDRLSPRTGASRLSKFIFGIYL